MRERSDTEAHFCLQILMPPFCLLISATIDHLHKKRTSPFRPVKLLLAFSFFANASTRLHRGPALPDSPAEEASVDRRKRPSKSVRDWRRVRFDLISNFELFPAFSRLFFISFHQTYTTFLVHRCSAEPCSFFQPTSIAHSLPKLNKAHALIWICQQSKKKKKSNRSLTFGLVPRVILVPAVSDFARPLSPLHSHKKPKLQIDKTSYLCTALAWIL